MAACCYSHPGRRQGVDFCLLSIYLLGVFLLDSIPSPPYPCHRIDSTHYILIFKVIVDRIYVSFEFHCLPFDTSSPSSFFEFHLPFWEWFLTFDAYFQQNIFLQQWDAGGNECLCVFFYLEFIRHLLSLLLKPVLHTPMSAEFRKGCKIKAMQLWIRWKRFWQLSVAFNSS